MKGKVAAIAIVISLLGLTGCVSKGEKVYQPGHEAIKETLGGIENAERLGI